MNDRLIAFRVPADMLRRIDELRAVRIGPGARKLGRSAMIRELIEAGLRKVPDAKVIR